MIQLIDEEDVVKKKITRNVKNGGESIGTIGTIQLIESDEVIDESKVPKINKKEKVIIKENAEKNKKYHLLRWKIKRFLIRDNIIKRCVGWQTILDVFDSEIVNKDDLTDTEIKKIFRRHGFELIEHHTKYKEIHGVDESLWMTHSEHRNLHNRLRREGKCNIDPEELKRISLMATGRTDKRKKYMEEYTKTEKFRGPKSEYCKANIMRITFSDTLTLNVILREEIAYNIATNTLTVSSGFTGGHGKKLLIMEID